MDQDLRNILEYLANLPNYFVSPTKIGEYVGKKSYTSASSWACRKLKKLVDLGYVEKFMVNANGHRYRITAKGIGVLRGRGYPEKR